ncbi:MAG TPA: zf-HC2 domain-containing protein [Candidatus Krumholzibacteria bacterium]|nr:zf-HC2 domain-containing protein [Candidatus Krumholzibacteria bacterium]HPD71497.1 zf-HC2 domain-containing protein [Candidatus Krumholzibacteria bacterium]HRY41570.1 zf-HC2 domain-containing protein [Candidatus Krumholzibacteria bacterium]
MKCGKVQEWIGLEIDGQLAPEYVAPLAGHLEACARCREFRDDLRIGLRMLHATDPVLPDNFDWKLQLRLSQAMREAARDAAFPWQETGRGWRRWFTRAGVSAAFGLAAVLSIAMLAPARMAPVLAGDGVPAEDAAELATVDRALRLPIQTQPASSPLFGTSRRPLDPEYRGTFGAGALRPVSSVGGLRGTAWSGTNERDLVRIRQLEQDLEAMRRRLNARERQVQLLEAKLDSITGEVVDTH